MADIDDIREGCNTFINFFYSPSTIARVHAVAESPATNYAKFSEMSVEVNEKLFRASGSPLDTYPPI